MCASLSIVCSTKSVQGRTEQMFTWKLASEKVTEIGLYLNDDFKSCYLILKSILTYISKINIWFMKIHNPHPKVFDTIFTNDK